MRSNCRQFYRILTLAHRLVKYHEALKVVEAREAGREEGRLEVSSGCARVSKRG